MTSFLRKYSKKPKHSVIESDTSAAIVLETRKKQEENSRVSEVELKSLRKEYTCDESSKVTSQLGILSESMNQMKTDVIMHSDLTTSMLACIIRFTAEEMKLIRTKYSDPKAEMFYITGDFTLQEKCTKPLFELYDYPTYLLGKNEMAYSYYKFEVDKCFITKLLMNMAKAIIKKKSYSAFMTVLEKVLNSRQEEDAYLNESYKNNAEICNIRKTRSEDTFLNKHEMENLDAQLTSYKNMIEDIHRENIIKAEYVDNWELSRNKQNRVMYRQRIEKLEREIKECQSKIERENRVSAEVERYTNMVHVDTEIELESWSKRHERELEEKEYEIQSLNEQTVTVNEILVKLRENIQHQSRCIAEGRELRKQLILRRETAVRREMAAVKIQAWWRRVRIRRGIGMAKKKRKKRGDKKRGAAAATAAKPKK